MPLAEIIGFLSWLTSWSKVWDSISPLFRAMRVVDFVHEPFTCGEVPWLLIGTCWRKWIYCQKKCVILSSLNLMSGALKVVFSVGKFCISLKTECVNWWKWSHETFEKQHLFSCGLFGCRVFAIGSWEVWVACFLHVNMFRGVFWT